MSETPAGHAMDVDTSSEGTPRFQVKKVCYLRVVLTKWNSVCLWSWDIQVDNVRRLGATYTVCHLPQPDYGSLCVCLCIA